MPFEQDYEEWLRQQLMANPSVMGGGLPLGAMGYSPSSPTALPPAMPQTPAPQTPAPQIPAPQIPSPQVPAPGMIPPQLSPQMDMREYVRQMQQLLPPAPESQLDPKMMLGLGLMGMGQQMGLPPHLRRQVNPMGDMMTHYMALKYREAQRPREEMLKLLSLYPAYAHAGDLDKRLAIQEHLTRLREEGQGKRQEKLFGQQLKLQELRDAAAESRLQARLDALADRAAKGQGVKWGWGTDDEGNYVPGWIDTGDKSFTPAGPPKKPSPEKEADIKLKGAVTEAFNRAGQKRKPGAQTIKPPTMTEKPPASRHPGRIIRDHTTGQFFESDGTDWILMQ